MSILSAIHAVATLMMAGLIWFVQWVHYPLFASVGEQSFTGYAKQHVSRTTWIVAPLMTVEAATAVGLVLLTWGERRWWLALWGVCLLAVIWASTAWLQVPCHQRLEKGLDAAAVRRLVRTNWIRTVAWSIRAVVAVVLMQDM